MSYGWHLPPGVPDRMIDESVGDPDVRACCVCEDEARDDCVECGDPTCVGHLDDGGMCPPCGKTLIERFKEVAVMAKLMTAEECAVESRSHYAESEFQAAAQYQIAGQLARIGDLLERAIGGNPDSDRAWEHPPLKRIADALTKGG